MTSPLHSYPIIAVIGGGFSGAAIAYHLACFGTRAKILVFEPRASLGAGLAYSTLDPVHRVNVPAAKMSLLPEDVAHFSRWLDEWHVLDTDHEALWSDGAAYPRRGEFGRYISEALAPFVEAGRIAHIRERVSAVDRSGGLWRIGADGGREWLVNRVVIATTHPAPRPPEALRLVLSDARVIADPLKPDALDGIALTNRVLVIGSGLTAADVVASFDARGHQGTITLLSRRGLRARGHALKTFEPQGDFVNSPERTAVGLLRRIRMAVKQAESAGMTWHPVFDALREQGGGIWAALPILERQRVVRYLRPYWDVHRFRIAPQIDAVLDRKLAGGSAELIKASLRHVDARPDELAVTLFDRRQQRLVERAFDRIVITTGPAHGDILTSQPFLAGLSDTGFIMLDSTRLGLATSRDGTAIGISGAPQETLFVAGPLARATFGELMGLPQVSDYALFIARQLEATLAARINDPSSRWATARHQDAS